MISEAKQHKITIRPAPLPLFVTELRSYPGMPDLLISPNEHGYTQRHSRRRGTHLVEVPTSSYRKKKFWRFWKNGKRVDIPVWKAMIEVGYRNHRGASKRAGELCTPLQPHSGENGSQETSTAT